MAELSYSGSDCSTFGEWLRGWRTSRRLPVNQLAQLAGLSRSTLQRWESDARRPCVPELELLLQAMGATSEQREQALYRVGASRTIRTLQESAPRIEDGTLPPPTGGDLLRAMRCRRRLSQEQVAALVGVQASTVCRWERSDSAPSPDLMERLLDNLGAHPRERAALAEGRQRSLAPFDPLPLELNDFDEIGQRVGELEIYNKSHPHDPLIDLRYLSLQSQLWPGLRRSPRMRYWYANSDLGYSNYLLAQGRPTEAAARAGRALEIFRRESRPEERWVWAAGFLAQAAAETERRPSPRRAAEILELWLWLPQEMEQPCHTGLSVFLRRNLALYLGQARQFSEALDVLEQCQSMIAGTQYTWEIHGCRLAVAQILMQSERPQEALNTLPAPRELGKDNVVEIMDVAGDLLIWTEVMLEANDRSGAHDGLVETYGLIETYHLEALRKRADALAERLNEGERGYALGQALVARDRRMKREAKQFSPPGEPPAGNPGLRPSL